MLQKLTFACSYKILQAILGTKNFTLQHTQPDSSWKRLKTNHIFKSMNIALLQ